MVGRPMRHQVSLSHVFQSGYDGGIGIRQAPGEETFLVVTQNLLRG
jgi:hypothetical protein